MDPNFPGHPSSSNLSYTTFWVNRRRFLGLSLAIPGSMDGSLKYVYLDLRQSRKMLKKGFKENCLQSWQTGALHLVDLD